MKRTPLKKKTPLRAYTRLKAKTPLKKSDKPIKQYTKKRAKVERERFSIFTNDLTKCIECGQPKQDLHECMGGSYRLISIKWGNCIPICRKCHQEPETLKKWQVKAQEKFVELYGYEKYIEVFKKDFIRKYEVDK